MSATAVPQHPIMRWEWEGGAIPRDDEAADDRAQVEQSARPPDPARGGDAEAGASS